MFEQRKYTRFNAEGRVTIYPKDNPSFSIRAGLADISMLGLGAYSQDKLEPGTDIRFVIINKFSEKPIIGEGRIRYCKGFRKIDTEMFRIGIEFTAVDNETVEGVLKRIQKEGQA
jgi:c-di-GMP-binding flagellar brake protein YcgR